ncbi:hypothetical protein ACLK1T_19250 [Escherichia coli]
MGEEDLGICSSYPRVCGDVAQQEKVATTDEEPILGQTYLPRKSKTTVVIPPQNDIDLPCQRHELRGNRQNGKLVGFNLLVGGGLSIEHGNKKTYPTPQTSWLSAAGAYAGGGRPVVTTQRDWGNRTDRECQNQIHAGARGG